MSPKFDKETFDAMVAVESDDYFDSSLTYLKVTLGVNVAWMKREGGKLSAYVYNRKSGKALEEALGGKCGKVTNPRGESYLLWTKQIEGVVV